MTNMEALFEKNRHPESIFQGSQRAQDCPAYR